MDTATAQLMSSLTCDFYSRVGELFSRTRAGAWPGWGRVLKEIGVASPAPRVLDLACGNLRFERALLERFPHARVLAVDSCDAMAQSSDRRIEFRHRDLAGVHLDRIDTGAYDVAVSFAFMHHLPLLEQRMNLMEALVAAVRPGGVAAVSFWRFEDDARLLAKARKATAEASAKMDLSGLGPHDYLMGWGNVEDAYRFCHHCTDDEIDGLIGAVLDKASVAARYAADGASGALNQYVILQRSENRMTKTIYLAGGCFWGIEHLMKALPGVVETTCGYANGTGGQDADYRTVCTGRTGFRETVRVVFDASATSVDALLYALFHVIEPEAVNRQSHDIGTQYQAGVYWTPGDAEVEADVHRVMAVERARYEHFAVEEKPLENFFEAEEYHQDYLDKNPSGYCHVPHAVIAQLATTPYDEGYYR